MFTRDARIQGTSDLVRDSRVWPFGLIFCVVHSLSAALGFEGGESRYHWIPVGVVVVRTM